MIDVTLISETPLSMTEVKDILNKTKKERKQLNFRETKTLEYVNTSCNLTQKEEKELQEALTNLNITRLKDRHIMKIIDMLPKDIEALKIIFIGEDTTIKAEDLNRIVEITKKYA